MTKWAGHMHSCGKFDEGAAIAITRYKILGIFLLLITSNTIYMVSTYIEIYLAKRYPPNYFAVCIVEIDASHASRRNHTRV